MGSACGGEVRLISLREHEAEGKSPAWEQVKHRQPRGDTQCEWRT